MNSLNLPANNSKNNSHNIDYLDYLNTLFSQISETNDYYGYQESENGFCVYCQDFKINLDFLGGAGLELTHDKYGYKTIFGINFNIEEKPFKISYIFVSGEHKEDVYFAYFEDKISEETFDGKVNSKVEKIINLSNNLDFDKISFEKLEDFINQIFKKTDFLNIYYEWYKKYKK